LITKYKISKQKEKMFGAKPAGDGCEATYKKGGVRRTPP